MIVDFDKRHKIIQWVKYLFQKDFLMHNPFKGLVDNLYIVSYLPQFCRWNTSFKMWWRSPTARLNWKFGLFCFFSLSAQFSMFRHKLFFLQHFCSSFSSSKQIIGSIIKLLCLVFCNEATLLDFCFYNFIFSCQKTIKCWHCLPTMF